MTVQLPFILAASEIEVIFGVIVFIIWVLSALAGKLAKKPQQRPGQPPQESTMERLQREVIERLREVHGADALPPPPPPRHMPPPPPPMNRPQTLPGRAMPPKLPPKAPKVVKQPKKPKVRPTPFADVPPPLPVESPIIARSPISDVPQRPASASVNATAIRNWLKPTTLQQQFILTELFQPPKSMRGE